MSNSKKIKALNDQIAKEQTKNGQLADFVKRAQRKILLVTKERDSYKSIIETYEAEVTMNVGEVGAARIQQQEAMLDTHRQQAAQQDHELESRQEQITALKANIAKVTAVLLLFTCIYSVLFG